MDVGFHLGPYELVRKLGSGATGAVYEAKHHRTFAIVAVKVLHQHLSDDGQTRARFLREARVLSQIHQRGVVRIYHFDEMPASPGVGNKRGTLYLVMEHLPGPSLRHKLDRVHLLPESTVLKLAHDLSEALCETHFHSIIHRDLKPENILFRSRTGFAEPVLVDFGIAKFKLPRVDPSSSTPPSAEALDTWLDSNAAPAILGTPAYMSPEVFRSRGTHLTPAADIYSLGVVLFELLAGERPFGGNDPMDLLSQHLSSKPDVQILPTNPRFCRLIECMLAKEPANRPSSQEVLAEVRSLQRPIPLANTQAGAHTSTQIDRRTLFMTLPAALAGLMLLPLRHVAQRIWEKANSAPQKAPDATDPPPNGIPTTMRQPLPSKLVLVLHPQMTTIAEAEAVSALPAPYKSIPRVVVRIPPAPSIPVDFQKESDRLSQVIQQELAPTLTDHNTQLVYFGTAPIPLALALGQALAGRAPMQICLRHHQLGQFVWSRPAGVQPAKTVPLLLPEQSPKRGEVLVRISTSHKIDRQLTLAVCPNPLWECDIALETPNEDAFANEDEVTPVINSFKQVLDAVGDKLTGVHKIHLFASVQGGVALRLGSVISKTMHPAIQTYQYVRNQRPAFVPALLLNGGKSMDLQPLFRRFHEQIALTYKGSSELRTMRDEVINLLQKRLQEKGHRITWFNQGSYAMDTGIKPPPKGDYDIDIGVVFPLERARYKPQEVKRIVHQSVQGLGNIDWRRPCITVYRQKYHMDIAVFVEDQGKLFLAMGKENEQTSHWQEDGLKEFIKEVENRFPGQAEDSFQMRRVIRYLKRWKDEHFVADGRTAPTGNALTVCAYKWFRPRRSGNVYNDLGALITLVEEILKQFGDSPRLKLAFPKAPRDDVFRKMSDEQMKQFKGKLEKLQGWLKEAESQENPLPLQKAFGKEFPS